MHRDSGRSVEAAAGRELHREVRMNRRWGVIAAVVLVVVAGGVGCSGLFEVDPNPHTVSSDHPIGLQELMTGATATLYQSFDAKIVWGGLFGDEFVNSGTAPSIQNYDRRDVAPDQIGGGVGRGTGIGGSFYGNLQQAVVMSVEGRQRIRDGDFPEISAPGTDSPEYARLSMYTGFARTWMGDLFCTAAFGGHGPELTAADVYAMAEGDFTEAINAGNAGGAVTQAALVGRARVRLILGQDQEALADAQAVDPGFELTATYSTNTVEEENRVWYRVWEFSNWSVGPAFRNLTIDDTGTPDPRVDLAVNPKPAFDASQDLYAPQKVRGANSPLRIATGDEARYIIAEIQGGQTAVDIINEVRSRHGITTQWSPSGGDPNEIRDKVIDERKRTLFLDGVRLGDLRRFIDKYSLDFFPTSTPQGFPMGDETCLPLPDVERNNNPDI